MPALTQLAKDELSHIRSRMLSSVIAEVSTMFRFAGGLQIANGKVALHAELSHPGSAKHLWDLAAQAFSVEPELLTVSSSMRQNHFLVRITRNGERVARRLGLLDTYGRPVRGLPPVTDPVEQLEREALAVIVQFPVAAHRAGADELGADSFGQLIHRAVYEAVAAAGGTGEVPGLVQQAVAAGMGEQEAQRRATLRWLQQVRDGAIGLVEAAITELAVAPLPLPTIRGRGTEVDASGLDRYARGVLSSLTVMGINRRLVDMRSRHRRMSPQDEGYRDLFSQIAALEQRRMQIRQGA